MRGHLRAGRRRTGSGLTVCSPTGPRNRRLIYADEGLTGVAQTLAEIPEAAKWAILIGPEGGFSDAERARLRGLSLCHAHIARPSQSCAPTRRLSRALALFQSTRGDWA